MFHTRFVSGDWNAVCDSCGFQFKASQLKRRWDGFMVCSKDYETRHPQDFVRAFPESHPIPFSRDPVDIFLERDMCTVSGRSAVAGYAIAGCSVAGNTFVGT